MTQPMCEAVYEVDDATFGYWNAAWGESPTQVFPCGEPADLTFVIACADGVDEVHLCAAHAQVELMEMEKS